MRLSPTFMGNFAHIISQLWIKSLRVKICLHPQVVVEEQYVYGFWHDKQFAPIILLAKTNLGQGKHAGLVSASGDGEMLTVWLKRLGYHVIRGSSSRKALSSLVNLISATKEGYSIGISADGPRGPRHEAKPGLAYIAAKSEVGIIPLGVAYSSKWQFDRSWDRYQLPRPFCKTVIYLDKPLIINNISDMRSVNTCVKQAIDEADQKALQILLSSSRSQLEFRYLR